MRSKPDKKPATAPKQKWPDYIPGFGLRVLGQPAYCQTPECIAKRAGNEISADEVFNMNYGSASAAHEAYKKYRALGGTSTSYGGMALCQPCAERLYKARK